MNTCILVSQADKENSENRLTDRQDQQCSLLSGCDNYRLERKIQTCSSGDDHEFANDDKVARILAIYVKAKDEYYNLDDSQPVQKLQAARFLRDTAENTLNYLHACHCSEHSMIPELAENFEIAKEKATQLSGGRKRRFEIMETGDQPLQRAKRRRADCYRP
jgi:hypothetical protein